MQNRPRKLKIFNFFFRQFSLLCFLILQIVFKLRMHSGKSWQNVQSARIFQQNGKRPFLQHGFQQRGATWNLSKIFWQCEKKFPFSTTVLSAWWKSTAASSAVIRNSATNNNSRKRARVRTLRQAWQWEHQWRRK